MGYCWAPFGGRGVLKGEKLFSILQEHDGGGYNQGRIYWNVKTCVNSDVESDRESVINDDVLRG